MFLETKKEGETQTEQKPSLAGFVAWLEKQPAEKEYDWDDNDVCACCQYAQAIGIEPNWHNRISANDASTFVWKRLNSIAYCAPRTFGGALKRARVALPKAE